MEFIAYVVVWFIFTIVVVLLLALLCTGVIVLAKEIVGWRRRPPAPIAVDRRDIEMTGPVPWFVVNMPGETLAAATRNKDNAA